MAKAIHQVVFGAFFLFSGCANDKDIFTVVEGTVTNKYTNQPVAAAPVSVMHFIPRMFVGGSNDSVTTTYTDASGRYKLAFDASPNGKYLVSIRYTKTLYDLTNYPDQLPDSGTEVAMGVKNQINIEVTPFKAVTINVNSVKAGKTGMTFDFQNSDNQNWIGGNIYSDTDPAHQQINFTRVINVLPNREYRFSKGVFNTVLNGNNVDFRDYVWESRIRKVLYNDTTTINFN